MTIAAGDFHALYERHAPALRRFVSCLGADPSSADDIVAETFTRAWTAAAPIRPDSVKAYLFTIARNLHRRAAKRAVAHVALPMDWADEAVSAERHAEGRSDLAAVLAAMRALPEDDRAALLMRAADHMQYAEIARILGLSVANARVRVHRARLKLMRAILPDPDPECGPAFSPMERNSRG
ncbi:MAG TPA: sigma-70 family RNA polymerase sigma factor [Allosphingosinicella sp.]|nr:sigma-70 family RNA polymerase sigma factor [Allosphingosinicella sp.]